MLPVTDRIVERLRAAGCVFAEDEAALLIAQFTDPAQLEHAVARRVAGEPLEYVLGWAEFDGRRYTVFPGVFVPRHRTEFLVEVAAALATPDAVVLDLCCGTGALGAALQARVAGVTLWASDLDSRAARLNLDPERVFEGDLFAPLPFALRGSVDILLCNTPYVPTGDLELLPREARLYERLETLDGGPDGLDIQRRVAAEAGEWLAPGGSVFVESSERQVAESLAIFERAGFVARLEQDDEWDANVIVATASR